MSEEPRAAAGHSGVVLLVVAYGHAELLEQSLGSVGDLTGVVVDNSDEPAVRRVVERHGLSYVSPGANLGFAGGVNVGLAKLADRDDAKYVLLLNPDAVLGETDLGRLVGEMQHRDTLAAVAPSLVSPTGRPEPTVWPGPSPLQSWAGALGFSRKGGFSFLNGAVLLLSRRALVEVGGFDERFFLYAEECDWQYRAVQSGWQVAHVPEATATHVGGATSADSQRRLELFHTSAALYVEKWYGRRGAALFLLGTAAAALRRLLTGGRAQRPAERTTLRLAARNLRTLYTGELGRSDASAPGQPPRA